jgi:hypothetical protein
MLALELAMGVAGTGARSPAGKLEPLGLGISLVVVVVFEVPMELE